MDAVTAVSLALVIVLLACFAWCVGALARTYLDVHRNF